MQESVPLMLPFARFPTTVSPIFHPLVDDIHPQSPITYTTVDRRRWS